MDKYSEDSRFERARELLDNELDREAEEAFSAIIELFPELEGAYGNRGLARMHLGRDEDALADFIRVAELDPEDAMAYTRQAEALCNLGRYREALIGLSHALELDPEDEEARYLRGWLFFRCQQYEPAIEDLEYFLARAEDYGEVEDMLSVCKALAAGDNDGDKLLRENGFSHDLSYNDNFEAEDLFCPYAHCVRIFPGRGPQAPDACPVTGFACPGGSTQAAECAITPF